jgi:hypothetical protein
VTSGWRQIVEASREQIAPSWFFSPNSLAAPVSANSAITNERWPRGRMKSLNRYILCPRLAQLGS